jgi:hypothetical protein
MWDELLEEEPDAMLTPWSRGSRYLPSEEDERRIAKLAPQAILVGQGASKPKRLDSAVERVLKEVTTSRRTATGRMGHTRARCGPRDNGGWRVDSIRESRPLISAA